MSATCRPDKGTRYGIKGIIAAEKEYLVPASQPFKKPAASIVAVIESPQLFLMGNISLQLRENIRYLISGLLKVVYLALSAVFFGFEFT
jgi:hypothetical protein